MGTCGTTNAPGGIVTTKRKWWVKKIGKGWWIGYEHFVIGDFFSTWEKAYAEAVRRTRTVEVELPILGRFNVSNALVALAIVDALGVDVRAAAAGLVHVRVPGRLEAVVRGQDFRVLVDYAHKPGAVAAVLRSVRAQAAGRVAVVLGAGGDRDASKRALMGAAAAEVADLVVVTDDNPRTEDPAVIRAAVRAGAESAAGDRAQVLEIGDRGVAIGTAIDWARSGDVVVIAGKGHETGQEINGVVHPFDDRVCAAEELIRRLGDTAREGETEDSTS